MRFAREVGRADFSRKCDVGAVGAVAFVGLDAHPIYVRRAALE